MKKSRGMNILLALCISASALMGCGAKESENMKEIQKEESVDRADLIMGATTGFFGAESLDVAYNWDGWIMSIYGISENLYRLDEHYVPQPWIAESVENPDENTWVFKIREGVTFSNGNPVDALAVKKCFERTYENNVRAASTLKIASMEASGDEFTIVTPEPNPNLLNDLCDPLLGIYDADGVIDDELGCACTGPFIAASFTPMTEVKMIANENYWGGKPQIETLELKIIDDENALNMALSNGEIDLIAQASPNGASLFTDPEQYTIDSVTTTRSNFIEYNLKSEGIKDLAVREAIAYCVDRNSFAEVVYQGYATPCYGVYPDNLPFGGTEGLDIKVDQYNAQKAKEILLEAGYEDSDGDGILDRDGVNLSFELITYSYNNHCIQLADMLQAELGNIGIGLNIQTYDVLDDILAEGAYDLAILNYAMAPIGTPSYFVDMLFASEGTNNYGGYSNPKVDELSAKLKTTMDSEETIKITKDICQEIINDHAFDFVANQQLIFVYQNKVKGVEINPTEYYLVTNSLSVEK